VPAQCKEGGLRFAKVIKVSECVCVCEREKEREGGACVCVCPCVYFMLCEDA
jgi:hypothetical protein